MNHYWLWKALPCEILRENITTSVQLCTTTTIDMHVLDTYKQIHSMYSPRADQIMNIYN